MTLSGLKFHLLLIGCGLTPLLVGFHSRASLNEQAPVIRSALPSRTKLLPSNLDTNSAYSAKPELLKSLGVIQTRQIQDIANLEEKNRKLIAETTTVSLQNRDLKGETLKLKSIVESLEKLARARLEHSARRQFIDQLIGVIDNKWNGQPLRDFLSTQLLDMAISQLNSTTPDVKMGTFLIYLSVAIREIAEPKENLIGFIDDYMQFASILEAKTPSDFLASRSYTNGSLSYSAKPVDRAKLGDIVEKRLSELGLEPASTGDSHHSPVHLELRLKSQLPQPSPSPVAPEQKPSSNS